MVVFRMISRSKWEPLNSGLIPADGITGDLRTQGNTLSLWQFDSAENDNIDKVGLALASSRDSIASIDIAWVNKEELSAKINFKSTLGVTPVCNLRSFHIDALNIDLDCLGLIARTYFQAVHGGNYKRLSRPKVKQLLKSAIKSGDLKVGDLKEKLVKNIES